MPSNHMLLQCTARLTQKLNTLDKGISDISMNNTLLVFDVKYNWVEHVIITNEMGRRNDTARGQC